MADEMDRSVNQGSIAYDGQTEDTEIEQVTFHDKCEFLNAIRDPFLEVVEPVDSRLMDELRQSHAISSDEENRVTHEHTRRDRARRTWMTLKQMPPGRFHQRCLPVLKKIYPHVLCGRDFCPEEGGEEGCVRCGLKERMLVSRFGDLFLPGDGCSMEEYSILVDRGDLEVRWKLAFSLCGRAVNRDSAKFVHKLKLILQKIEVTVPDNLAGLLAKEVPCACPVPQLPAYKPLGKKKQREKPSPEWKGESISSGSSGYRSTNDDEDEGVTSLTISSHDTGDSGVEDIDGEQGMTFDTQESKVTFYRQIEEINLATERAASIRPLYREQAGIKEELAILRATTKDETKPEQNWNGTKFSILVRRAREVCYLIRKVHRQAQQESEKVEGSASHDALPDRPKAVFCRLRQHLRIELQENQTFVDSLERNLQEIGLSIRKIKAGPIMEKCKLV